MPALKAGDLYVQHEFALRGNDLTRVIAKGDAATAVTVSGQRLGVNVDPTNKLVRFGANVRQKHVFD